MGDESQTEARQCSIEGCENDWDEWATARGTQHGFPAQLALPVCEEHLEELGGDTEPLTFEVTDE